MLTLLSLKDADTAVAKPAMPEINLMDLGGKIGQAMNAAFFAAQLSAMQEEMAKWGYRFVPGSATDYLAIHFNDRMWIESVR